jgi:hypothetical protein
MTAPVLSLRLSAMSKHRTLSLLERIDWVIGRISQPGETMGDREFCRKAHVSESVLSNLRLPEGHPKRLKSSLTLCTGISNFVAVDHRYSISLDWLINGRGEPLMPLTKDELKLRIDTEELRRNMEGAGARRSVPRVRVGKRVAGSRDG